MADVVLRNLTAPGATELNLLKFLREAEQALDDVCHEVLQQTVAAGTARGWFPTIAQLIDRLAEHEPRPAVEGAIQRCQEWRLLETDGQKIRVTVSGITHERTPYAAVADGGVPFFLRSALDVLTIAGTLQKAVTVTSQCPVTRTSLTLGFDATGELVAATPRNVTAFMPGWDGQEALGTALARGGLFAGDEALETWQHQHGDPDGMPLTEATLRGVGMQLAQSIAARYVAVSVFGHHA